MTPRKVNRSFTNAKTLVPRQDVPPTTSWWLCETRDEFTQALAREQPRMAGNTQGVAPAARDVTRGKAES